MRTCTPCCNPIYVFLAGQVAWGLLIVYTTIAKISVYGVPSFLKHVTNWAWLLQGVYYLASATVLPPPPPSRPRDRDDECCCNVRCAAAVAFWLFLPMHQIVWFVFGAVVLLLAKDPEFVTDVFASIAPGIVIIFNDVFHTYPVLAVVLYAGTMHRFLYYSLNRWLAPARGCALGWLLAYQITGGALLFAGAYFLLLAAAYHTSVNAVYGTDIPVAVGFSLYIGVGLLVNGIPLLMLICCWDLLDPWDAAERRAYDLLYPERRHDVQDDAEAAALPEATYAKLCSFQAEAARLRLRHDGKLNYNVFT